jgi:hypothetical protein
VSSSFAANVLAYGYLLVAAAFLTLTYVEGRHSGEGWTFHRVLGLALCCVWPLPLLIVIVTVWLQRRRPSF